MRDEAEYYRGILDNLTGGFLSVDLAGGVAYINPTACRILKLPDLERLVGAPYDRVLEPFPELRAVVGEVLSTRKHVHRAEVRILHADTPMTIGYSTLPVRTKEGETLGIGLIFQDLTVTKTSR